VPGVGDQHQRVSPNAGNEFNDQKYCRQQKRAAQHHDINVAVMMVMVAVIV
jgi:hypothetical protein